jgi:hypothetical protein
MVTLFMLVSSASPSWLLILRRSQKTSLNGVPAYIQIDPSQLFTKPSLQILTQVLCHMATGGVFTDESFIRHFIKLLYPLITLH